MTKEERDEQDRKYRESFQDFTISHDGYSFTAAGSPEEIVGFLSQIRALYPNIIKVSAADWKPIQEVSCYNSHPVLVNRFLTVGAAKILAPHFPEWLSQDAAHWDAIEISKSYRKGQYILLYRDAWQKKGWFSSSFKGLETAKMNAEIMARPDWVIAHNGEIILGATP